MSTHDKRRDTRISSVSSFGTISANRTTKLTDEDKNFAKAGSSKNIYCNSLCPAYTKTPLVTILTGEKEQKVLDAMSLHRAATPEEVANSVLFLASDAASFVQGENLNCDGGMLMNG